MHSLNVGMFNDSIYIKMFLSYFWLISSECSFISKALHAQESGALGVIIMNHELTEDDNHFVMRVDLTERDVKIPAMFLQYRDGYD